MCEMGIGTILNLTFRTRTKGGWLIIKNKRTTQHWLAAFLFLFCVLGIDGSLGHMS
jgi:hypothetical protein